ncbi:hypothetical protein [Bacillus sp. X1(2014)]|uniref:hypothetical protein n=1 Tax=Bacillus sp. X1(2014) TaxID=1565991 RepID=UPI0011A64A0B|nr:hypothetical protein [Bacillus sp. X1(2014)]
MREQDHKLPRESDNYVGGLPYLDTSKNPSIQINNPYLDTTSEDPSTHSSYTGGKPYLDTSED